MVCVLLLLSNLQKADLILNLVLCDEGFDVTRRLLVHLHLVELGSSFDCLFTKGLLIKVLVASVDDDLHVA